VSAARIATALISQLRSIAMTLLCARSLNVAVPGSGPRTGRSPRNAAMASNSCRLAGSSAGNIPDDDVVSFTVIINQVDRGHGSALFQVMNTNTVASTDDITEDGLLAYAARNRLNISDRWEIGPLEIAPIDDVAVVYTGTNTSDSSLSSLGTQKQDELEIKILDIVAKKYVSLLLGAGFGDDIGSAFSEAYELTSPHIRTQAQGPALYRLKRVL
jgi:hypothetical protein